MSVIVTKSEMKEYEGHGYGYVKGDVCSFCSGRLFPPFLAWSGNRTRVLVCMPCAERVKDGFTADLIQLAATAEMQRIYPGSTLRRKSWRELQAEEEKKQKEEYALVVDQEDPFT